METLIDRDELYKALASWDWQDLYLPVHFKELVDDLPVVRHSYEDGIRKGYEDAVLNYGKMALMQWIPVSERLPEVGRNVLLSVGKGLYTAEGELKHDGTWVQYRWSANLENVDAWAEMPEPWRGEEG